MFGLFDAIRSLFEGLAASGLVMESFRYGFVVNSLISALFIGPILGAVGTMVVTKRLAFFSQAVGQAALTGVAIGILLGEDYSSPYASLFGFCILFGLTMNYTRRRTNVSSDTLIAVFLSISLAVGASLLLWVTSKVNVHILDNILFGSILTVTDTDITVLIIVSLAVLIFGLPQFNKMLVASFDTSLAHSRGLNVQFLDYAFIFMIIILTVAAVKIVGAVLVEALLVIPAATARVMSRSIKGFVGWSVIVSTISCLAGVIVPMEMGIPIPSGGAIIIVAATFFAGATIFRVASSRFSEVGV
jgi:zinc transport system permease protein